MKHLMPVDPPVNPVKTGAQALMEPLPTLLGRPFTLRVVPQDRQDHLEATNE
jgi:hypothetical protein